jgi:hypothetical protein
MRSVFCVDRVLREKTFQFLESDQNPAVVRTRREL